MSTSHPELFRFRAGEGLENDIANAVLDALTDDEPVGAAVLQVLTESAIERYSDKISAMLRRGGIEIENGEPLDAAKLLEVLGEALGYDLEDLSESGFIGAVDAEISRRMSEAIGFEVVSVLDAGALASDIEAALIERVGSGTGGLVSARLLRRLKDAGTWSRAGYDAEARRRVMLSVAQRRYRVENKMVWVT